MTSVRSDWENVLYPEVTKTYWLKLEDQLDEREKQGAHIIPSPDKIFRCFEMTSFYSTKVVIVGQDPYPNAKHADGLAFSVPFTTTDLEIPPSLKNIQREFRRDLNVPADTKLNPSLTTWAANGVLLLNSVLTTESGKRGAHEGFGWEKLTEYVIKELDSSYSFPKAFIFLGAYAQQHSKHVTNRRHLVLNVPHPSPLSAHRGFYFSSIFTKANKFLVDNNRTAVNWMGICQPKY